jgi:aryl-alcohol dehydrogenase-like predicted oxidoreductase
MIFGEDSKRSTSPGEAEKMIHQYLDAGGNHIDTANAYAGGRSEEIVGKAVKDRRDKVVIATKVRFGAGSHNEIGLSRGYIMAEVEASLKRLGTDYIDLYYMHAWDPLTPIEESLRAFNDLVAEGKVRYIGVSNFKAWQVMNALGVSEQNNWCRFIAGQYQYSLVKRDIECEYQDLCSSQGIGIIPWGALGGGFLSGKYKPGEKPSDPDAGRLAVTPDDYAEAWHRRSTEQNWHILEKVNEIAEKRDATYSQIALAWVKEQQAVSSVILGARTMDQLEDNLKAAEIDLSAEELEILDKASALPEMYPYRMIDNLMPARLKDLE